MDDHHTARRTRRAIGRRLTFANVVALGALFVALGGGAYAATSSFVGPHGNINTCVPPGGGEVNVWKPGHQCSGGRVNLAFPTVGAKGATGTTGVTGATGASGATGATGATNPAATTVDGESVTKLLLKVPTPSTGTSSVSLYSGDGLTILAECASNGDASLVANGPSGASSDLTVSGYEGSAAFGSQTGALGPTSSAALGPVGSGESSFSYASSSGSVVTGDIGYEQAPSFGDYAGCGFSGTVTSG